MRQAASKPGGQIDIVKGAGKTIGVSQGVACGPQSELSG